MCTALSILQGLNRARMDPGKWETMWNKGMGYMLFATKLYPIQRDDGRFFLHEHLASASSWRLPEMQSLTSDLGIKKVNAHMCRFKMMSEDEQGKGLVKKPTGFLTNSEYMRRALDKQCLGSHRHVHLMGGRAKACQVYPEKLVRAILKGIRAELVNNGTIAMLHTDLLNIDSESEAMNHIDGQFVDDMSGQTLNTQLVLKARKEEMDKYFSHSDYDKVPIE